jgi:hypothetical protein
MRLLGLGFAGALLACAAYGAIAAGCGDLTVPNNTNNDGGGSGPGEAGAASSDAESDAPAYDCSSDGEASHPTHVACTGLYSAWPDLTKISPDVHAYDPGIRFWNDGADTSRFIYLPPGQKIDTSSLNEWKFPVGTKLWMEIRLLGKRVETRFLWKIAADTWFRTTYAWNDDASDAPESVGGATNVGGIGYEIPSGDQCATCHSGRVDFVLGFELVSLSTSGATGLNVSQLVQMGLLSNPPPVKSTIPSPDALTATSLAFLHSNCGTSCHNNGPSASAASSGLFTRLDVDSTGALPTDWKQTSTFKTAYNVVSAFTPVGQADGTFRRIKPGDAAHSAIPYRTGRRDGVVQMPPFGSHVVDTTDVKSLTDWINAMPPPPQPDGGTDAPPD